LLKNIKSKLLFFVLIVSLFGTMTIINVHGYTTFTGYVKDKVNNALSGATVLISDNMGNFLGSTTTSASGYYSLSVTLTGYSPYYVTATKAGYVGDTKTVTGGGSNDFSLYGYLNGYVKDSQNNAISGVTVRIYHNTELLGSASTQSSGYYYVQIANTPTKIEADVEQGFRDYSHSLSTTGTFNFNMQALKAIIVGISDYLIGNDLDYCDEDASDWYDQLDDLGYICEVYGDNHPENYPIYTGIATESNIRSAIQSLASNTGSGDTVCFIFSGHGDTNIWGTSYLYTRNCLQYKETEIKSDFDNFESGVNLFFFFDSCGSGGIIDSLDDMSNEDHIYIAATCTEDGYGYDGYPARPNGAWTYYFLEYSWIAHFGGTRSTSMESVFDYAHTYYPYGDADEPQEYDGNSGSSFYL